MTLKAPFPWFGGKRRVAHMVWRALGECPNYVEPFFGSGAVLLGRPHEAKIETVNDADCVVPETRILRADLTWALAGEIKIGDRLVGFDEQNGEPRAGLRAPKRYRRLAHATVTGVRFLRKPCYRLTFDDGTTVTASDNHLWLGGSHVSGGRGWRWTKTKNMVCNRKTQRSWVLKVVDVVDREETWEAGWLGGLIDGEGCLHGPPGMRVTLAQNEGPTLDRAERILSERGFACTRTGPRRCRMLQINVGLAGTLGLLMRFRPERLIAKVAERLPSVSLYGRKHRAVGLVSKEFVGEQIVVAIETDCKTFIAEGLASHNCYLSNFWRAVTLAPAEVARWADWPVNEIDMHARHKWLVGRVEFRERMRADPDFYDAKIAGWWVWGICQWIGGGWCVEPDNHKHSRLDGIGKGVHSNRGHHRKIPDLTGRGGGRGVHSDLAHQLPELRVADGAGGRGIHASGFAKRARSGWNARSHLLRRPDLSNPHGLHVPTAYSAGRRPHLSDGGQGVHLPSLGNDRGIHGVVAAPCEEWFLALQNRLRRVRVACGDWTRVLGPSVLGKGKNVGGRRPCAVFLDPPYSHEVRDAYLYAEDAVGLSDKVRAWAIEHGDDPELRIALCGYEGEHEMPASWTKHAWKAARGYAGADNENSKLERIWFSPHCLPLEQAQKQLFGGAP